MKLEVTDLVQRFGETSVLGGISFALNPGERLAVIGPNGAGKTTLVRAAAGLLQPTSGAVRVGEDTVESMPQREIARRIGLVPQGRPIVFDYTAFEYVLMGFHARNGRFSLETGDQRDRALDALKTLEVARLADQPLNTLSGGELQRVVMARTMVMDVPIWLLDEPTSSLDLKHQVALIEQVIHHTEAGGSALAVFHDPSLVHRYFDRVLVLFEGRIAADGPPAEVLTEDLMSEVFDIALHRIEAEGQVVWAPRK